MHFSDNFTSENISDDGVIYIHDGPYHDAVNNAVFVNTLLPAFIYICILLLIGIPGNVLVIYVYLLKWKKNKLRTFLLSLAYYDLFNCLTSMTTEVALILNFIKFDYPILCKVSRFATAVVTNGSTFLLIAIAVDRYRRICRIYRTQITTRQARLICVLSILYTAVTSWPLLFLYGTYTVNIPIDDVTVVGKTCLIEDAMLKTDFPFVIGLFHLIGHFIVDVVLIIHYSLIGQAVCRRRQSRQRVKISDAVDSPSIQLEQHGGGVSSGTSTMILFLVTLVFILSFLPYSIIAIIRYQDPGLYYRLSNIEKSVYQLFLRSYFLNSVLNPIVYCFVSKQFREKAYEAIRSCFGCRGI